MNKTEKLMLLSLAALQFTNVLDFMIMAPLGPQLMRSFSITTQEFGYLLSCYTISAGVSGFVSAFFADRFDRKVLLFWCYVGFLIGTLLCGIASSYEFLLFARLFTGAFGGILGATCLSIVSDIVPMARRGQAMGLVMASFSLASVLGIPIGLKLATSLPLLGWHAPFQVLAVLGLPILLGIRIWVPSVKGHLRRDTPRETPIQILGNVAKDPNQLWALSLMALMMFGQFIIIPFISPSMVFNVGLTEADLPQIYFFGGLATIFTGPLIGKLSDITGKKKIFVVIALLSVIPIYFIANLGVVSIWLALSATTGFFILSSGRGIVASALVTNTVEPKHRGSFMSINSSVQQLSAGMATLVGGMIVTRSVNGHLDHLPVIGFISIGVSVVAIYIITKVKNYQEPALALEPLTPTDLVADLLEDETVLSTKGRPA
jgi:predicted MFS family arabinose efflux permease